MTILLQLAGDSQALAQVGSCLAARLSRMPDVEIATGPSAGVRFIVDIVAAKDFFASLVVAETFPMEQYRARIKEGEDSDALLAGLRSYTLLRLHELVPGRSRQALLCDHRCRNRRQGVIQGIYRAERLISGDYWRGSSIMFDAKSLLDTILGGQTAQQATAAAQSAGSAVAGVVSQAEETLKGTAVGDALSGAKNFAEQNPTAAVAVAGGLAAVLLGTSTGRSVAAGAVKLGGLAGLGGIAYKAISNWQQSKPLMEGVPGLDQLTAPAPTGSGFHTDDHSHDTAQLIVRAMAATASADGTIDPGQRATLVAQLQRAGLGSEESAFLDEAVAHPMSPGEIARSVSGNSQLAAQVVAAASLVADPANAKEQDFLSRLGAELGMSGDLVSHIKAAVSGLGAS